MSNKRISLYSTIYIVAFCHRIKFKKIKQIFFLLLKADKSVSQGVDSKGVGWINK